MLTGATAFPVAAVDGLALLEREDFLVCHQVVLFLDAFAFHDERHAGAPQQKPDDDRGRNIPIPEREPRNEKGASEYRQPQASPRELHHLLVVVLNAVLHGFHVSFDQLVHGRVEKNAQEQQTFHIGIGLVSLPVGHRLARHVDALCEIFLRHAARRPVLLDVFAKLHVVPFADPRLP